MSPLYRDYVIENVREDRFVPYGRVYVIEAKYTLYHFDYINDYHYAPPETKHELFIIPRDYSLLNQILEKSKKNNNAWKVDINGDDFRHQSIYYVDGTSYSKLPKNVHKSIRYNEMIGHNTTLDSFIIVKNIDFDDFLRKTFNSMILNQLSKSCHNSYLYTFDRKTRKFSANDIYLEYKGEVITELVFLEDVYKGIQHLISEEQLNRLNSEIRKSNPSDYNNIFSVLTGFCEIRYQIGIGRIYKDLCKSLALASLKEADIPYIAETGSTNQPRYW